ncbi:MAG: class I SAM-dependent methyltransferase, partial [Candidatus Nanopelagicaceae bacterium]
MLTDIEDRLSLDQRAAADFVLTLRKRWSDSLYPAIVTEANSSGEKIKDHVEAESMMKSLSLYPWFSHLERAQQKMLWRLACDVVLENESVLLRDLASVPNLLLGSLDLNSELLLPDYYTAVDIHMQPGSFFSNDLSAFIYQFGARIVMLRDNDGYKFHSLFAQTALPNLPTATRIVDFGCGFGKSTAPLPAKYPSAEVIGLDLAAPGLKLAHLQAEAARSVIHYRQADAAETGIESGTCDVVTGTMLLHEMPSDYIKDVLEEAFRILKPGGTFHFLEFAPTGDPIRDATVYEHAERNNEPFFRDLFATDTVAFSIALGMTEVAWTAFDERSEGLRPQ